MSKSIRYYYFTSIATVLVASVMVMGLIQIYIATGYFRNEKEKQLGQVVASATAGVRSGEINLEGASRQTLHYLAQMAEASVFITDANGLVIDATQDVRDSLMGQQIPPELLAQISEDSKDSESGYYKEMGRLGGLFRTNYYAAAAELTGPSNITKGFVFAVSDAAGVRAYLSEMLSSFVLGAALVLLVASVLAILLANRTVIPLRHINEAARQFGEGNFSARVPVMGDDELAQLAVAFNDMANSFEATDQSRRSFMGNIAHELRTPMTSIKGFIDGMLDGTIPEDQRDRYLGIVSEEVGRLARLTKNMLDISKLEAGEYTPNAKVFDIWGPVASVFLGNEQRLGERHIEVLGIQADRSVGVLADEDFVHQILFNLVDNAIKFTGENGKIFVRVQAGKSFATISIRNTGAGIAADALPHIFDRFYKADKSRGINARGSGLGLHICKVLVGLMGGRIWAESEEGLYTEFNFTLPAATAKKAGGRRGEGRGKKPGPS